MEFDNHLQRERFENLRETFVGGDITYEQMEEVLDGIMRNEPPYITDYVLSHSSAYRMPDGKLRFFGEEVSVEGTLCRKV